MIRKEGPHTNVGNWAPVTLLRYCLIIVLIPSFSSHYCSILIVVSVLQYYCCVSSSLFTCCSSFSSPSSNSHSLLSLVLGFFVSPLFFYFVFLFSFIYSLFFHFLDSSAFLSRYFFLSARNFSYFVMITYMYCNVSFVST